MAYALLKLGFAFSIPFLALIYARHARFENDRVALICDVSHPANVAWQVEHPAEALQAGRVEVRYLDWLILDMN